MALPTNEIKFDSTFIGRIPVLTGSKNYDVWSKRIISTLSAYSVWEFVVELSHMQRSLLEQTSQIVNRSGNF